MSGTIAIYDASVLYPGTLRDLLIRVAMSGLVRAKWTEQILDEVFAAIRKDRPDLDDGRLERTRMLMGKAVRDWRVTGYEGLIGSVNLPDLDDRHVVAAAIRAGAQTIMTSNLRDFPADELARYDIEAQSPDAFVKAQIGVSRDAVYAAVQQIANSWRNPPGTFDDVLDRWKCSMSARRPNPATSGTSGCGCGRRWGRCH